MICQLQFYRHDLLKITERWRIQYTGYSASEWIIFWVVSMFDENSFYAHISVIILWSWVKHGKWNIAGDSWFTGHYLPMPSQNKDGKLCIKGIYSWIYRGNFLRYKLSQRTKRSANFLSSFVIIGKSWPLNNTRRRNHSWKTHVCT